MGVVLTLLARADDVALMLRLVHAGVAKGNGSALMRR